MMWNRYKSSLRAALPLQIKTESRTRTQCFHRPSVQRPSPPVPAPLPVPSKMSEKKYAVPASLTTHSSFDLVCLRGWRGGGGELAYSLLSREDRMRIACIGASALLPHVRWAASTLACSCLGFRVSGLGFRV
jgi:hypothetical protein